MKKKLILIIYYLMLFVPLSGLCGESYGTDIPYNPHEVLVKFEHGTDEATKISIRDELGAILLKTIRSIKVEYWQLPATITTAQALEVLKGLPAIDHAEPNYLYSLQMLPNDAHFDKQWFLHNIGQIINGDRGTPGADIAASEAWEIETGSKSVVIALIDSGVAFDHPDLRNNVWYNPHEIPGNGLDDDLNGYSDDRHGWDFVNDDNNPSDYSRDLYGDGHGTHVAGIIAAQGNNGIGIAGIMWQAQIMPLQVFDLFETGSFRDAIIQNINIMRAIEYAVENGAMIINCSFGSEFYSQFQYDLFEYANQHGVLVVAAAGNESTNNDTIPIFPASYDLPNIISVAATDGHNRLSSYSNYGEKSVDVAAPGGDQSLRIFSTIPPEREIVLHEDFESGDGDWSKEGKWEKWSLVFNPLFNSMVIQDSALNYHSKENSSIQTIKPIYVANYKGLNIQFKALFKLEKIYDFLFIEGSNDGVNFSTVFPITGYITDFSNRIQTVQAWGNDDELGDRFYLRFRLQSDESKNYDGVYIDDITITGIHWHFSGDEYDDKMGTSMAAPVVSGVAGLIWSHQPGLTHLKVKEILLNSVDRLNSLSDKVVSGGRVNAAKALGLIPDPAHLHTIDETEGVVKDEGNGCFILSLLSGSE
ncbi:MAG: S8 family serine peptidase [bacterium]